MLDLFINYCLSSLNGSSGCLELPVFINLARVGLQFIASILAAIVFITRQFMWRDELLGLNTDLAVMEVVVL